MTVNRISQHLACLPSQSPLSTHQKSILLFFLLSPLCFPFQETWEGRVHLIKDLSICRFTCSFFKFLVIAVFIRFPSQCKWKQRGAANTHLVVKVERCFPEAEIELSKCVCVCVCVASGRQLEHDRMQAIQYGGILCVHMCSFIYPCRLIPSTVYSGDQSWPRPAKRPSTFTLTTTTQVTVLIVWVYVCVDCLNFASIATAHTHGCLFFGFFLKIQQQNFVKQKIGLFVVALLFIRTSRKTHGTYLTLSKPWWRASRDLWMVCAQTRANAWRCMKLWLLSSACVFKTLQMERTSSSWLCSSAQVEFTHQFRNGSKLSALEGSGRNTKDKNKKK